MILKSFVGIRDHFSIGDPKRHEKPEEEFDNKILIKVFENHFVKHEPQKIVDDLDPTEDGEASEETHCASNKTKLGLSCHLSKKMIKVSHKMTIFVLLVFQFWFMRFDVVLQFHR